MGYTKVKVKTRKSLEAEIEKSSVHVSALEGAMYKKKKKERDTSACQDQLPPYSLGKHCNIALHPLALTGKSVITSMKQILVLDKARFILKIMTNMLNYIAEGIL